MRCTLLRLEQLQIMGTVQTQETRVPSRRANVAVRTSSLPGATTRGVPNDGASDAAMPQRL